MTNTLINAISMGLQYNLEAHAICLLVKGGGAFGDRFGQGERAENAM